MMTLIDRMNEITARTEDGTDCTQEDSIFILQFFDRFPPGTPEGDAVSLRWPLEADQWWEERNQGYRRTDRRR